ncbi:MAG: glycoside hydrolase family 15 protein [Actinomycetota bacterium]|nr:glycoside hydrolase family 15 protein [Actinomycetota bacterium]
MTNCPGSDYLPIENYGIVGDLRTVALVGLDASVDFMSLPQLDAPTVFAGLLDRERGGCFRIDPTFESQSRQMYLPGTNVLLTRFLSSSGVAEVSDFMPISEPSVPSALVRRLKCVHGNLEFRVRCAPRFDYARVEHSIELIDGGVVFLADGADGPSLVLRSSVPLEIEDGAAVAIVRLGPKENCSFVLQDASAGIHAQTAEPGYVSSSFKKTVNYWYDWSRKTTYTGRWQEMVNRSALVLKLLTSRDHGSIAAAPTFGLPEQIGGPRNWDYRYAWIRDSSFTVDAFLRLGYTQEATDFMGWIQRRCEELGPDGSLQIMYGLDGRHELAEQELDHLEGYRGSSPVRIGNAAYKHLQLDIYGEFMGAVFLNDEHGEPVHHDLWNNLVNMVNWVCKNWDQPDEGIWEVRGGRKSFLFSRLMCWVAVDRGVRLAMKRSRPAPVAQWLVVRDKIYADIFDNFWNEDRQAFVQSRESTAMDAAALLMPLVGLISPKDPRWLSTMRAIEEELVEDSLVFRYRTDDGIVGGEGTFSICSFWYVECLARSGDLDKARFLFEKMLSYANHLGLYSEELGPSGEHLGNYPQAFTHLALISAAHCLDQAL